MTQRFVLGWYNGWSPEERLATVPVQREAIRSGALEPPTCCSICGFSKQDDPDGDNRVWLHDEDYGDPLRAYAVCRSCHRTLHARFETPRPWAALLLRHGDGGRWFERLSMDPQSQRRPFAQTYPDGLPPV